MILFNNKKNAFFTTSEPHYKAIDMQQNGKRYPFAT